MTCSTLLIIRGDVGTQYNIHHEIECKVELRFTWDSDTPVCPHCASRIHVESVLQSHGMSYRHSHLTQESIELTRDFQNDNCISSESVRHFNASLVIQCSTHIEYSSRAVEYTHRRTVRPDDARPAVSSDQIRSLSRRLPRCDCYMR